MRYDKHNCKDIPLLPHSDARYMAALVFYGLEIRRQFWIWVGDKIDFV